MNDTYFRDGVEYARLRRQTVQCDWMWRRWEIWKDASRWHAWGHKQAMSLNRPTLRELRAALVEADKRG